MDVLVADTADDEGLAAACGHPRDPFGLVFLPLGAEVFEATSNWPAGGQRSDIPGRAQEPPSFGTSIAHPARGL
jgi:hypothetical protein